MLNSCNDVMIAKQFVYYGILILQYYQHEWWLKNKNLNFDIVGRSQVYEKFPNTTTKRIEYIGFGKITSRKG